MGKNGRGEGHMKKQRKQQQQQRQQIQQQRQQQKSTQTTKKFSFPLKMRKKFDGNNLGMNWTNEFHLADKTRWKFMEDDQKLKNSGKKREKERKEERKKE